MTGVRLPTVREPWVRLRSRVTVWNWPRASGVGWRMVAMPEPASNLLSGVEGRAGESGWRVYREGLGGVPEGEPYLLLQPQLWHCPGCYACCVQHQLVLAVTPPSYLPVLPGSFLEQPWHSLLVPVFTVPESSLCNLSVYDL